MAKRIRKDKTVIDYFNSLIEYDALNVDGDVSCAIALDKEEWIELIQLYKENYKDCMSVMAFNPDKDLQVKYKDLMVFYDGLGTVNYNKTPLWDIIDNLQEMINRRREPQREERYAIYQGAVTGRHNTLRPTPNFREHATLAAIPDYVAPPMNTTTFN